MEEGVRAKALAIAGLLALSILVNNLPWERQSSGLTEVVYSWGEQQEENAENITNIAVSGAEGSAVGEHQVKGANWSIPNILRHWFGVD